MRDEGKVGESALRAEGIAAVVKLEGQVLHLLAGLNADQYAAEMRGQLAAGRPAEQRPERFHPQPELVSGGPRAGVSNLGPARCSAYFSLTVDAAPRSLDRTAIRESIASDSTRKSPSHCDTSPHRCLRMRWSERRRHPAGVGVVPNHQVRGRTGNLYEPLRTRLVCFNRVGIVGFGLSGGTYRASLSSPIRVFQSRLVSTSGSRKRRLLYLKCKSLEILQHSSEIQI